MFSAPIVYSDQLGAVPLRKIVSSPLSDKEDKEANKSIVYYAYDAKFFIILLEKAFKMMKNGIYFIDVILWT